MPITIILTVTALSIGMLRGYGILKRANKVCYGVETYVQLNHFNNRSVFSHCSEKTKLTKRVSKITPQKFKQFNTVSRFDLGLKYKSSLCKQGQFVEHLSQA